MSDVTNPDSVKPVYIPWTTFEGFLESLTKRGVPATIDSTAIEGLSNGMKSQLRSALKFLRLTDESNKVQPLLVKLVAARGKPEHWKLTVGEMLVAYAPIIKGVDLSRATVGNLRDAFRENGKTSGQVNEKAVRFYLAAATAAGIQLSGFLTTKEGRPASIPKTGGGPRVRRSSSATARADEPHGRNGIAPKQGWIAYTIALDPDDEEATINVSLPRKLTQAHVKRLHAWLQSLAFSEA